MDYHLPQYDVVVPARQWITPRIGITIAIIIIVVFLFIGAVIITLSGGLSIGLSRRNNNSSHPTSATNSTNYFSILTPPIVNCNYSGPATCGCSPTSPSFATPRIVQGYNARANSWPWTVLLIITLNNGGISRCGGALITYQHVLTAAHCVALDLTPARVTVYAGIQTASRKNNDQIRGVANITIHPQYNEQTVENDIAILTLNTPVTQTPTVGLCCLNFDAVLPRIGERGVVLGWGNIGQGGTQPDNLLQAVIEVHNQTATCQLTSETIQFCAGFNGTDTCQGDSGGPFIINVNNTWVCAGIISYGIGCGKDGAYTRVSAYQQFIDNIIKS